MKQLHWLSRAEVSSYGESVCFRFGERESDDYLNLFTCNASSGTQNNKKQPHCTPRPHPNENAPVKTRRKDSAYDRKEKIPVEAES